MKLTEAKLEKAFTELLGNEGYSHHSGKTINPPPYEVLIEADLQNFFLNQYKDEGITVNEVKSIVLNLKWLPASDINGLPVVVFEFKTPSRKIVPFMMLMCT